MDAMDSADLYFDPNEVDGALVVECWISHGPRAEDETFDPRPGDMLTVSDDEEPAETARVVRRDGNRVWVQILLPTHA
jgi:hypothetical protein